MKNKHKSHIQNKSGDYWLFGRHACLMALQNIDRKIKEILVTKQNSTDIPSHFPFKIVTSEQISKIVGDESVHQGIAIKTSPLKEQQIESVLENNLLLILDQVTDPHNIGAILRSAAAFGAGAIITTRDNSPEENGTIAKSASGALEIVPIIKVTNLARAMEQLKNAGHWLIGLDGEAKDDLHKTRLDGKITLVLGAEGKGMRKLTAQNCDILAKLPINQAIESLNVSNAAAIALYEANRNKK